MADLDVLLERTSRTFALCIPLLPEPTRREVAVAYLLFRIADTFEDATATWPKERRSAALADFSGLLAAPEPAMARRLAREWVRAAPTEHEGYLELLAEAPFVLESFLALDVRARRIIAAHARRSAAGMAGFVARTDASGALRLADLADLRHYCFVVAGLVGEMLTELFLLGREHLAPIGPVLRERDHLFGEALQLTNILKDSATDAAEGRHYLPPSVDRGEVFSLARRDLEAAAEYTRALHGAGAPGGVVAFNALPARLARATLDRVEGLGPGASLTRPEVFAILTGLIDALDDGGPVLAPESR